ncbi:DUF6268 family outer membrane beta-barrel protein [Flavobacterium sp. N3904]|uniref:DUF6268 family outer membrane beta-barrel protein n=1 Tax=Flavobacterium sp. N3904 TaxID=2986835 RepID=UPI002225563D|nr:DUF6268 family outer membrane beta-barrel protein [Flavobacterium sp. N3904]
MRIKTLTNLLLLVPLCSVYAQTGYTIDLNLKTEPTEKSTINETEFGVMFFKSIGAKNKLKNTFKYKNINFDYELENYIIKNYASQNNSTRFNAFEDTFELSHQLTDKTILRFEIEPTANFDSNFKMDDITILGGFTITQTINNSSTINIGVNRTTVFGKPEIWPTFYYSKQINKDVSIKLGFPNSEITYSNTIQNKFSLKNTFNGTNYNMNKPILSENLNEITKIGFSQIETTLEYERNMDTSWFICLKGGYAFNKQFTLSNQNFTNEQNETIKNGAIFNIGIKYKH